MKLNNNELTKLSNTNFSGKDKTKKNKEKAKKDLLEKAPVRSLAYCDEIGAVARPLLLSAKNPIVKNLSKIAYIPAGAYVVLSIADKYKKGEDGTGKKPSAKTGFREALYQGATSIAAPALIVKGALHVSDKIMGTSKEKLPKFIQSGINKLKNAKVFSKLVKNKTTQAKLAGLAVSIASLALLSKPVDKITDKLFSKTVDPLLNLNKLRKEEVEPEGQLFI